MPRKTTRAKKTGKGHLVFKTIEQILEFVGGDKKTVVAVSRKWLLDAHARAERDKAAKTLD